MGALSKLLCPIQRDLEDLALSLEEKEKDDSVVPRKDYDALTRDRPYVNEGENRHSDDREERPREANPRAGEGAPDSDRIRARMDRYLTERDNLRAHQSGWEREKVAMGHRFLNWLLQNPSVSHSAAADSALRAWMHADKILENANAKSDFESSDGFTVCPGNPGAAPRLFSLPEPPSKQPGPDKDSNSKGPTAGKGTSSSSAAARATDSSKSSGKPTDKVLQKPKSTPSKSDGSKTNHDPADFDGSELNFGIGAKPAKQASDGSESARKSSPKGKAVSKLKDSDISKKRLVAGSESDVTKRPRLDPSPTTAKTGAPSTKDMFGSDTDEEKPKPQGDTDALIRQIRDVYAAVVRTKPWRRYQSAVGSFLPDIPIRLPAIPDTPTLCGGCLGSNVHDDGQDGHQAWERLVYRLTRLVAGLYILINYSDFNEDLIRFLCHPHPAWPQVFKNPINLLVMGKQQSTEVAVNYLLSQNSKFWPRVPLKSWLYPLGSTFALLRNKAPGKSVSQVVAKRIIDSNPSVYGKFDKTDLAGHIHLTKEAIEFMCKVAAEYVDEPGYDFKPETILPFVTGRPQSDPDMPQQWFGKRFYPNTMYVWTEFPKPASGKSSLASV
ncbi:hypothetical protein AeNC1_013209 [Aphanomyces euteiches]|nr:hypothetical protein AeNC1_013209 [Aphanomyces euteiches]